MSMLTRQEIWDEIVRPYYEAVQADAAAMQAHPTPAMERAWRKCLSKGKPPRYETHFAGIGDTIGLNVEIEPPEGWTP